MGVYKQHAWVYINNMHGLMVTTYKQPVYKQHAWVYINNMHALMVSTNKQPVYKPPVHNKC